MIAAALGAALTYAVAMVLQHRGAQQTAPETSMRPSLFVELARRRAWLAGVAVNVVAFGLRAIALGGGALVVVQPLVLSGLVIALVIETITEGRRFTWRDVASSAAVIGGVTTFLLAASPSRGHASADAGAWLTLAAIVSPVVVGAIVVGVRSTGARKAGALAVAGGVLLAATAALTKQTAVGFSHEHLAVLTTWSPYALGMVGLAGTLTAQSAFQAAPLRASLPVLNVVEPVVSIVIGALVLHEHLADSNLARMLAVVGLTLLVGGVIVLSEAVAEPEHRYLRPMPTNVVVPAARPVFSETDRKEIADLIDSSLTSGSLTLGPTTLAFEAAFAALHDAPHAIAVSSGTAALEIIFRAIGVEGKRVIVPTNTFFATAAAVQHAGGIPVLADVDVDTLTLSTETIEAVLTDDIAGVVLVHIGGAVSPASADIAALCKARGMWFVEDAAHAHGASLDGTSAGSFGIAAAFSFYPTKVMTSGEGGMIVTSDATIDEEARIFRDQGKAGFLGGDHVRLGYAWRMSEVHAAIGLVQVRRLPEYLEVRRHAGSRYDEALARIEGITPLVRPAGSVPNFYKYIALLDAGIERAEFKQKMRDDHGVAMSGEVYASPLHKQPIFDELPVGDLSIGEDVCARHVCLPVHNDMTDAEIDLVIDAVRTVAGQLRSTS